MRTRFAGHSDEEIAEGLAELAEFRDTVLARARITRGETVADVGTGTGLIAIAAVERVGPDGTVVAIDISADCLEEVRRIATAPNIVYLIGTAEVLPLPNESIDAVLTRSVLIYVSEKDEAASEFFRVLRPGGRVSLFEPINSRNLRLSEAVDFGELASLVAEWDRETYSREDDPMLNFDEHDLVRCFEEAGFRDIDLDLRSGEGEMSADRMLNGVGAPGRKSILEIWQGRFSPEEVDELVRILRSHNSIRRAWPQVYLSAVKP